MDYRVINMELIIIVHVYIDRCDKLLELSIIPYSLHSFSRNLLAPFRVPAAPTAFSSHSDQPGLSIGGEMLFLFP